MSPDTRARGGNPVIFSGRRNNDLPGKVGVDQCGGVQNSSSRRVITFRVSLRWIVPLLSLRLANPEQCLIYLFNCFLATQDADVIFIETAYGNRLPLCFET
jgi:hypothetical protein